MENTCKPIRSLFICALAGATAVIFMASAGCRMPTGDGVGIATYVRGDLEASLANGFNPVVDATHKAIKELGFTEISAKKETLSAVIVVQATSDRKIEISIADTGKGLINIKIRVGLFGDEQLSHSLLGKVKAEL